VFTRPDLKSFAETYRRIGRDLLGMSSLWLAEDHLVYVKGTGFLMPLMEEYKRFRLTDIQAISIARTSRFGKGFLYLASLLLCSGIIAIIFAVSETVSPAAIVAISILVLLGLAALALLVRHLILGPTCVCDIQTSLSRERLRPLTRYHHSLQTISTIERLVRESQAGLDRLAAEEEGGDVAVTRQADTFRGDTFQVPRLVPPAFGLFLILGLGGMAALHLESSLVTGGVLLLILMGSLMLTMTLVAVVRKATPNSVRLVLWITMGIHFVVVGAGAVYFLIAATNEPAYTVGITGPLEAFTAIATTGGPVFYGLFTVLFLGFFSCGLWGILESGKWRRRLALARRMESAAVAVAKEGDE
jgi:hypothetical protein